MPQKHQIRTNCREVTGNCSTYRLETKLRVSGNPQLKEEYLLIKFWFDDVINCVRITKMKGWQYMMMQKAQIWKNNKYYRFNILIQYTAFLKLCALILTPFLIRTSHLRSTMAQVVIAGLLPRRPRFDPKPFREEIFVHKYVLNCTNTPFLRHLLPHPILHHPPKHRHLSYNLHCVTCCKNILSL